MARGITMFAEMAQWLPGKASRAGTRFDSGTAESGERLELLLPFRWPDTDNPIQWCVRSNGTIKEQGSALSLEDLNPELASLPLSVLLSPLDTALLQISLPAMSRKNLVRAIPFALEDRILGEVEQQFFTLMHTEKESTSVCVIAHERMQAILGALKTAGFHPHSMLPALNASPLLDNTWTMAFNEQAGWVRTGEFSGMAYSIESDRPPYGLKKSLDNPRVTGTCPTALLVINAPDSLDTNEWSTELGLDIMQPEGGLWENLGDLPQGFNLLQGPYKQRSTTQSSYSKLRLAIALILILVIGNTAIFGFDWFRLYRESRTINSEMVSIFKQSFPDQASTVVDPVLQMQRNLDRLRQDRGGESHTDFLALLSPVSKVLSDHKAQINRINKIRYANRAIIVDVQLADYQNLDRLKQAFVADRFTVEMLQAESGATGVQARLKLETQQELKS
jgi:general secretion pathway protein L